MEENRYQRMHRESRERFMRDRLNHERDLFYGEGNWSILAGMISFRHVIDDDTIIVATDAVRKVSDGLVLVVGDSSAVYLREYNVKPMHTSAMLNVNLVKLDRGSFEVCGFGSPFEGFGFGAKVLGFDDMAGYAREQDEQHCLLWDGYRRA